MGNHMALAFGHTFIWTLATLLPCVLIASAADTAMVTGAPSASRGTDSRTTSYIPLTDTFTPPPECSDRFMATRGAIMAYGVGYGVSVDTDLACAPGEMITYWDQTNLGVSRTVISAGPVVCPLHWSTALSSVTDSSSTFINCCPPEYSYTSDVYGNCVSNVQAGDVLTYATSTTESASVPSEWSMTTETIEADFMVVAMAVVGWNVKYPTTSPTSRSATSADPVRTTSSSTSVPSDTPSSDDLSSGAKAGIGVGVAVGVIGILALLGAIFLIRRKRKNQASSGGGDDSQWNKHELPTTEAPRAELSEGRTGEPLGGYYKDDRATDRAPVELAAEERPQEMYTDHE